MNRPLLLIDVDGPLNPYAASNNQLRKGKQFRMYKLLEYRVWLSRWHGEELLKLADAFELTWCTTWSHHANTMIGPKIGLPDLPVVEFAEVRPWSDDGTYFKTHEVVEYAAKRPFVWLDDEIDVPDFQYVGEHHDAPAKLIQIDPRTGLTQTHFDSVASWATALERT